MRVCAAKPIERRVFKGTPCGAERIARFRAEPSSGLRATPGSKARKEKGFPTLRSLGPNKAIGAPEGAQRRSSRAGGGSSRTSFGSADRRLSAIRPERFSVSQRTTALDAKRCKTLHSMPAIDPLKTFKIDPVRAENTRKRT
jgi:hypothetical protein